MWRLYDVFSSWTVLLATTLQTQLFPLWFSVAAGVPVEEGNNISTFILITYTYYLYLLKKLGFLTSV